MGGPEPIALSLPDGVASVSVTARWGDSVLASLTRRRGDITVGDRTFGDSPLDLSLPEATTGTASTVLARVERDRVMVFPPPNARVIERKADAVELACGDVIVSIHVSSSFARPTLRISWTLAVYVILSLLMHAGLLGRARWERLHGGPALAATEREQAAIYGRSLLLRARAEEWEPLEGSLEKALGGGHWVAGALGMGSRGGDLIFPPAPAPRDEEYRVRQPPSLGTIELVSLPDLPKRPVSWVFERCYEAALLRNHRREGTVRLSLRDTTVRASGDRLGDPELTRCVIAAAASVPRVVFAVKGDATVRFAPPGPR